MSHLSGPLAFDFKCVGAEGMLGSFTFTFPGDCGMTECRQSVCSCILSQCPGRNTLMEEGIFPSTSPPNKREFLSALDHNYPMCVHNDG